MPFRIPPHNRHGDGIRYGTEDQQQHDAVSMLHYAGGMLVGVLSDLCRGYRCRILRARLQRCRSRRGGV